MCGIVGLIARNKQQGFTKAHSFLLHDLLIINQLRGTDGTGIAIKTNDNVVIHKTAQNASYAFDYLKPFIQAVDNIHINGTAVVGHNRAATRGNIHDDNSHPFQHEHITLVHNGTLYYHSNLYEDSVKEEVDSRAITIGMSKFDNPKEFLPKIRGAYALAWIDKKKNRVFLARNKERPLCLIKTKSCYIFSSEYWIAELACKRQSIEIESWEYVEPFKLYSFGYKKDNTLYINKEKYKETDIKYYEPAPYKPQSSPNNPANKYYRCGDIIDIVPIKQDQEASFQYLGMSHFFRGYVLNDTQTLVKCYVRVEDLSLVNYQTLTVEVAQVVWKDGVYELVCKQPKIIRTFDPDNKENYVKRPTLKLVEQIEDELEAIWTDNGYQITSRELPIILRKHCDECHHPVNQFRLEEYFIDKDIYNNYMIICPKCMQWEKKQNGTH